MILNYQIGLFIMQLLIAMYIIMIMYDMKIMMSPSLRWLTMIKDVTKSEKIPEGEAARGSVYHIKTFIEREVILEQDFLYT